VIGEASDGEEAVAAIVRLLPDLLLLEAEISKLNAIEVLERLALERVSVQTILLVPAAHGIRIEHAIGLGVRGVVLRSSATELLMKSIRCVLDGQFWLNRDTMTETMNVARQVSDSRFGLTKREKVLIAEITEGSCNKDIASKFSISEMTVKRHLVNIFDKVGVSSRLELAVFAMHHGLGQHYPSPQQVIAPLVAKKSARKLQTVRAV
jgi:DNA-binding NarL/FixJ family response regulator